MAGAPLEGIRVVDLTSVVVGPLATQFMADYGADIIKVEALTGDIARQIAGRAVTPGMSSKFVHLNRNKRSVALNLKKPAGYEALMRLLKTADIMLWNVRPSAMKRLKLSYDDVRAVNPRIIYCGLFGFGQDGRYREKPAYDTIIQGGAGVAELHNRSTGTPRYVPIVVADRSVGNIAVQMLMMALFHRERTGEGSAIEIPMFENMARFVLEEHMYLKTFDPPLGGTGDPRLFDPEACPKQTADGWISISANTNEQAFAFFDAIERPELKTDPRFCSVEARFANVNEYFKIRNTELRKKTTAEWIDIFDRLSVPAMPVHTLESLMEDPHLTEIGFFQKVDHPTEGKVINMRLPNKTSFPSRSSYLGAPKIGQQSMEILHEAGYSEDEIQRLVADKVTVDGRLNK
jgi:crotonobetainyl-CoA:carnitine CoA-transferase CaiB-like acyl-CoA transferase